MARPLGALHCNRLMRPAPLPACCSQLMRPGPLPAHRRQSTALVLWTLCPAQQRSQPWCSPCSGVCMCVQVCVRAWCVHVCSGVCACTCVCVCTCTHTSTSACASLKVLVHAGALSDRSASAVCIICMLSVQHLHHEQVRPPSRPSAGCSSTERATPVLQPAAPLSPGCFGHAADENRSPDPCA